MDIGCGIGLADPYLKKCFSQVYGVDICSSAIEVAIRENPYISYKLYDGNLLPYPKNFFDVSFAMCVMHHVPPQKWEHFIKDMYRVTKVEGLCFIFEHNPVNPITRLIVSRCKYDRDAMLVTQNRVKKLFSSSGIKNIRSRSILYFPFDILILKKLEESVLSLFPFGTQYYVVGTK